jgi:protein-S-isoprenylcysteine O-methyltransferase Ste14
MNLPTLVLCLCNLALIGALPRLFFRRGRLNARWWLTAAPFLVCAGVLLAGGLGWVAAMLPASPLAASAAAVLSAASLTLIGFTLGTHREPVSLWHQEADVPARLVTHGAYARLRHPFYSAFLLALLACVLAFPHPVTAVAFGLAVLQLDRTAAREEGRLLASALGAEYAAYVGRTGRFVPARRRG